ncbi:MAG: enoyl-CoA hydratase/isomerase family protein [Tepidiformaceae bacterium]
MPDYTDIIVEERGDVALVKFNRPESLNAMGGTMTQELGAYLETLNSGQYRIRAVVLTGEGRAFCAGGDVKGFPGANPGAERPAWRRPHPTDSPIAAMRHCDVPIIGAINGYAVGGGFGLALATDFRICAENTIFQVAQVKRGLTADVGLPFLLQSTVGTQRALELICTARRVDAQEALALGLVLEVVPPEKLVERALEIAATVAKGPPLGLSAGKRLVYLPHMDALYRVEEMTNMVIGKLFETEDGVEGARSFLEKREPVFKGR